jgi:tetratricopeptide (TPR) repeat protein
MKALVALCLAIMPLCLGAQPLYKWTKTEAKADTLLNNRQVTKALKAYNKVVKKQKQTGFTGQSIVRFKRALCYYYLDDFNNALADLNTFIVQNPDYPRARLLRAYVYREMNRTEEQLTDLEEVLRYDAYNTDLQKWRAGVLLELGKAEEALHALRTLKEFYTDEEVELYMGLALYFLKDYNQALEHFNEAIFIHGGYLPAYRYAATMCIEQQQYIQALAYLPWALMLEPDDAELMAQLGIALVETGQTAKGCAWLGQALNSGFADAAAYLEEHCH